MNDNFDDLDRALFALPLEEPPPGLRRSILEATIFSQARVAAPVVGPWESVAAGTMLAIGAWLIFALIAYKGFAVAFDAEIVGAMRALAEPASLMWLVSGCAIAAWLSFLGSLGLRLPVRGVRS
jgi:hypothetical protein